MARMAFVLLPLARAAHPTLPTMWTALAQEAQVGIVQESETFVYGTKNMSPDNPSAKWTNFTDGSCSRLIYADGGLSGTHARFLIGCGQQEGECCHEHVDDDDAPIEYQIPNVHPAAIAPVKSEGKLKFTDFNGDTFDVDVWSWRFTMAKYMVYTTPAEDPEIDTVNMHRWDVNIAGQSFPNEYSNYQAVRPEDAEAHIARHKIPEVCKKSSSCNEQHKAGLLSEEKLAFLRAGQAPGAKLAVAV